MSEIFVIDNIQELNEDCLQGKNVYIDAGTIKDSFDFLKQILIELDFLGEILQPKDLLCNLSWVKEHEINIILYNCYLLDEKQEVKQEIENVFLNNILPYWENKEFPDNKLVTVYFVRTGKDTNCELAVIQEKIIEIEKTLKNNQEKLNNLNDKLEIEVFSNKKKDEIIDNLHNEVSKYKNGLVQKITENMSLDIIQLIDAIDKNSKIYEEKPIDENSYKKLLSLFKGITDDLKDILYRQDIEAYNVAGDDVDVKRQKIVQIVKTDDIDKNNKVAERIVDGYETPDKIIRAEKIKIYKFYSENL